MEGGKSLKKKLQDTARYRIISDTGGNSFCFFCDISGAVACKTKPIKADTVEEELNIAWMTEGKKYFNRCYKCGRWVSDVMYNADVCECVDCAPWENPPKCGIHCGEEIFLCENFCRKCGTRLRYGEVWK